MNVRLTPDEIRTAVREYLERRGIEVSLEKQIKFEMICGAMRMTGELVTEVQELELDVKDPPQQGPFR